MKKEVSDLSYPDFALYYRKALKLLKQKGTVGFTDTEAVVVGHITSCETDQLDAIGDRIVYEVDDLMIPKYVCLVLWLSPFGISSHHPKLAWRLANFLLGLTTEEEVKKLPLTLRRDLGV
jgi:hypothetical protein